MHAAIKAGLETIPAIVRDMEDDEAIVIMVDANIQREELLPSEKAFAYKMKMDAMKRQGIRTDLTSCQNGTKFRADAAMAEQIGESARSIQRYIRLTELIPDLLDYVDKKRLQFTVAVDISYIDKDGTKYIIDKVKSKERCASRKAGGTGIMYTVLVDGKECHLYYEFDKWFMERKSA